MLSSTKKSILAYIQDHKNARVVTLIDVFGISKQAMHRHLNELVHAGYITKVGLPPQVYYIPKNNQPEDQDIQPKPGTQCTETQSRLIEKEFVEITPTGNRLDGLEGFEQWCKERSYAVKEYAEKFEDVHSLYDQYYNSVGVIDATGKLRNTFNQEQGVDELYYGSFSAIEIFGKTKAYSLLLYAKQTQNRGLISELLDATIPHIMKLIIAKRIEYIGVIPPTVRREYQLMTAIQNRLKPLDVPFISIKKLRGEIVVPQKSLKSPYARKMNAKQTFIVDSEDNLLTSPKRILIVDDFVGSASTINYTGRQLKQFCDHTILGYAIAGTPNGVVNASQKFEVVQEV